MAKVGDVVDMSPAVGSVVDMGGPAPKPTPRAQPQQKEGLLGLAGDAAKGVYDSVSGAIRDMPNQRAAGTKESAGRNADVPWYRPDVRVGRAIKGAWQGSQDEWDKSLAAFDAGIKAPLDKRLTPAAAVTSDATRNMMNAAGVAFSPITGAIKGSGLATDVQAATGLSKDAAANALLGVGGGVKAGGDRLAAKGAARVGGALAPAKAAVGRVFNPAGVDDNARATATIHRIAHGTRRAEAASDTAQLDKHQRVVGNASVADQRALAQYVDTRSKARPLANKALQPAADAMRDTANRYRTRIEGVLAGSGGGGPSFVQDYYARLWKERPAAVQGALQRTGFGGGKQGSGRSLKARSVPTFEDGLKAGLTPVFENPLDATNAYVDNMATFLATHDVQREMRTQGLAKMVPQGSVPEGWVPLKGIRSEEPGRIIIRDGEVTANRAPRVLAAPEGAARVYNNFISKGLDRGDASPFYQGARKVANGLTQMKLGMSTFHAAVMGQESIVAEVAKGMGQLSRGDVKGLGTIAKAPAAPVTTAMKGSKLRNEILDPQFASGLDPRIKAAYVRAGGRVNMDRFYSNNTASGDFFKSWRRGTLSRDVGEALKGVKDSPIKGSVELAAKTIESTAAPIFKSYIPRLKAGAFASRMEAFLKENPSATDKEMQTFAERTVDSIDNRFGEMIVDNQFWHKAAFQIGQLVMLSPSWNVGTVREIGGGLRDLPKSVRGLASGKGITDKTAYVAALVGTNALINGAATYLHTGQMPEGRDWLAYRTGGTDAHGAEERAQAPGYMKDVLAFAADFPNNVIPEIENKANPGLSAAFDAVNNKDWRGLPIVRPAHVQSQGPDDNRALEAAKWAGEQVMPISMSQRAAPGSKISLPERALAVRPAPSYLEDPERRVQLQEKYGGQEWKKKLRADARAEAQSAPAAAPPASAPAVGSVVDMAPAVGSVVEMPDSTPVKPGATSGGDVRPELKPIVDHISALPELNRITAENDLYHPASDVHGQGRAVDFTVKGGAKAASTVVAQLRKDFASKGLKVRIINEYANPSARSTGGHIHVQVLS